ncbi:hypothetical protein PRIPAC_71747 [Pristionchus pacificus]|uniref:Uncharacterized protein n=1 Tax=Pristionchus pacificus TaxID=54126 RepID=A0A454XUH8_PRIPA|nr:hypothetical protein PRIPAC_71747 [Pristionchus pacificus]|eukprot:PDM75081.1 hypothetical protein PRIPAC_40462 [Pristionchus pacificus]
MIPSHITSHEDVHFSRVSVEAALALSRFCKAAPVGVPDSERAEMDEFLKKEQMAQEKRRKSREEKMKMGV